MKDKPRNDYPFESIEFLRKEVLKAYYYFEDEIALNPNTNRESPGYNKLKELVKSKTDKDISPSGLVQFFTKKPFYNEGNDKLEIAYELYTYNAMKEFVQSHRKDEANGYVLDVVDDNTLQNVKTLFHQLYENYKAVSTAEMKIIVHETGTVDLKCDFFMRAKSDIANVRLHCWREHEIKIISAEAHDSFTNEKFNILPYEVNDKSYYAFILFPRIIKKNTTLKYNYAITIENYYKDLIDNGELMEERVIVSKRYDSIVEEFYFPNTEKFKNINLTIISHPDENLKGKELNPTKKDGFLVFKLEYKNLKSINIPVKFQFRLS